MSGAAGVYDAIPLELRERPQWVAWKSVARDGQEKPTKEPRCALAPARKASSTNRKTWATFEQAVTALDHPDVDGLGYVFADDDPYVGIDLDTMDADAAAIILTLDSYTEHSVSGTGAHVIVRADLNGHPRKRKGPLEIYSEARYFVMTGKHMVGCPAAIESRQPELEMVLEHFLPTRELSIRIDNSARAESGAAPNLVPVSLDDRELIDKAESARNGHEFAALYAGTWDNRYSSQSEADLALCSKLAFWTGRDPERIDNLFRSSGLMRDKWERADYRERTISEAVAGCRDVYTPSPSLRSPTHETPANRGPDRPLSPVSRAARPGVRDDRHDRSARRGATVASSISRRIDPWTSVRAPGSSPVSSHRRSVQPAGSSRWTSALT